MKERKFYFDYRDDKGESQHGMVPVDRVETLIGELLTEVNRFKNIGKEMNRAIVTRYIDNCESPDVSREEYNKLKAELITAQCKVETLKNTNHVLEHKVKINGINMNGLVSNFNDLIKESKSDKAKIKQQERCIKMMKYEAIHKHFSAICAEEIDEILKKISL